jgi:hypothetical protein
VPKIELSSQSSSGKSSGGDGAQSPKKTHRVLPNFLSAYLEYSKESESPESYHLWTCLTLISSAIRRNVWLHQGIYILYPNLFTVLVGPPGIVGKSTAIRLGRDVLQGVENIIFGPDSVTREELIRLLAKAGGKNGPQSPMTIFSTELSSLIEPSGIKMIQFLTDIYDCDYNPKGWKYGTKQSGRDTINNPVLNILAGTTPSWIADDLPLAASEHGFTSRTIFVYEEEPRYLKPFPHKPDPGLVNALHNDLDHISRLEGEFEWGKGTKEVYEEIYKEIHSSRPIDYRVEGFHNRKRVHVLKIAMLLSIAERDELVLEPNDIKAALSILNMVEDLLPKTFSAMGKYEYAADMERIYKRILRDGELEISRIYREYSAVGDTQTLGHIIGHLNAANMVRHEKRGQETFLIPIRHDP